MRVYERGSEDTGVSNVSLADGTLYHQIRDLLNWDKRVSTEDINFIIRDGKVILFGQVDSLFRKKAAVQIVEAVATGMEVVDYIDIARDTVRTDHEMKEAIRRQLKAIKLLPGEFVTVDVCEGVVKLDGIVFRPRLKGLADSFAWELSGVRDCLNMIEIGDYYKTLIRKMD